MLAEGTACEEPSAVPDQGGGIMIGRQNGTPCNLECLTGFS
jgi:hypothetical protein